MGLLPRKLKGEIATNESYIFFCLKSWENSFSVAFLQIVWLLTKNELLNTQTVY